MRRSRKRWCAEMERRSRRDRPPSPLEVSRWRIEGGLPEREGEREREREGGRERERGREEGGAARCPDPRRCGQVELVGDISK